MQHFFLNFTLRESEKLIINDARVVHQMERVLRMRSGEHFIALDGSGLEYECAVMRLEKDFVEAEILQKRMNEAEPSVHVTLFQALPKKMELFEWVLQKGTEIGVSEFVPLVTERTERSEITKPERLLKILMEAAEQSERGKLPRLVEVQKFEDAVRTAAQKNSATFLLHGRGDYPLFSALIREKTTDHINLFIGPEGGFSESEIELAIKNDVKIAALGKRVLRTETAGIMAAALALS